MNRNTSESFARFFEKAQKEDAYWEEMAILEFTEAIAVRLKALGLGKQDWAKALEVKPSQVTKFLAGENNFTLRTMVKLARSLGCEFVPDLRPEQELKETYIHKDPGSVIVPFRFPDKTQQSPTKLPWPNGEPSIEKNEDSAVAA